MRSKRVHEIWLNWLNMARNGYKDQRGYLRFGQYFMTQPENSKIVDSDLFNMEDSAQAYSHILLTYVDHWD